MTKISLINTLQGQRYGPRSSGWAAAWKERESQSLQDVSKSAVAVKCVCRRGICLGLQWWIPAWILALKPTLPE